MDSALFKGRYRVVSTWDNMSLLQRSITFSKNKHQDKSVGDKVLDAVAVLSYMIHETTWMGVVTRDRLVVSFVMAVGISRFTLIIYPISFFGGCKASLQSRSLHWRETSSNGEIRSNAFPASYWIHLKASNPRSELRATFHRIFYYISVIDSIKKKKILWFVSLVDWKDYVGRRNCFRCIV